MYKYLLFKIHILICMLVIQDAFIYKEILKRVPEI